jgi:hypothetical protein
MFEATMRQTPLDENEIARLRILRASSKPMPNPKWYAPPRVPTTFKFKPGAAPVFPAHVKPNTIRKPVHIVRRCQGGPFDGQSLDVTDTPVFRSLVFRIGTDKGHYECDKTGGGLMWVPA